MAQAPLKARASPRSNTLLPRSHSYNALSRPQVRAATDGTCHQQGRPVLAALNLPHLHAPLFPPAAARSHASPPGHLLQASFQGADGMWDRMQRGRPMRNALLLLLSLILAANCVWAVQGLAAWRRGRGLRPEGSEQLMLQRLNATVLSVEVRLGVQGVGHGQEWWAARGTAVWVQQGGSLFAA